MVLYLTIIFVSMILIITLGFFFFPGGMELWEIILNVVILTIAAIVVSGLIAYLTRRLPEKWFLKEKGWFYPSNKEENFYKKIKIKKWKDKVIELGKIGTDISKKHVDNKEDPEFITKFIMESNYGQLDHLISLPFCFVIIVIFPFCSFTNNLFYSLTVSFVASFLNLLPLMVLRYNMPRLLILKKRALKSKQMPIK